MEQSKVQIELNKFRDYVIKQARTNLSKGGKNSSSKLYNSLGGTVKANPNSFEMEFFMEEYGVFQDAGVKGAGGVRKTTSKYNKSNNKGKMWKQNGKGSPYSFKTKKPPISSIKAWPEKKGLSPFALQKVIFHQGIKPSLFFTKPFEAGFKRLPEDLVEAYGLDALTIFNEQIDEIING